MKPVEIGRAYDRITHLWQSEDFNRENGIAQHRRAIAFVENRRNALDVGCGCSGRFIDLLQAEGFTVEGVDISERMIALARQRHPEVVFHHQDICEWEASEKYDLITAWDSIWHVLLVQQEKVMTRLVSCLADKGVLIFSCGGLDEASEHTDDFMGPEVYYSTLGINGFLALLMKLGCQIRHLQYDQYPEAHAYLIVQKG